jgi:5-methylcytosine-specific restriction protein A
MREVAEWVGSSDDAKVPPRVRLRVFEAHGGKCWLSGRKIMPGDAWDLDHKLALCNGGEHRESNLAPALKAPHVAKTKIDRQLKAKADRIRKRHLGIVKAKGQLKSRGFDKTKTRKFSGEVVSR